MMKFLHLADLHLGRSLMDYDLIDDQKYILDRVVDIATENEIDAILMAGDIYDRAVPSEAATRLLNGFITTLSEKNIKLCIISGNHDSDDRLNYGSDIFKNSGIYISAKYDGSLHHVALGDVDIYMLPFVKASQVKHYYPDAGIETYEDAVRVIIESADIDTDRTNILMAHQFVTGGSADPDIGGSESVGTRTVGLVEKISYKLFDDFDYVALGHIHSPQKIGREEVRYSGSPLKYSLSEVNNKKSIPLITTNNNSVKIDLIPLEPRRELRHIKGTMKELLDGSDTGAKEDYIYVTLTDEDPIENAIGIFRQTYPNIVKLDYDNSHTRSIEYADISDIADNKPFAELIGDFYKKIYGIEMSEEEMDVMREVAREAGVLHEAD